MYECVSYVCSKIVIFRLFTLKYRAFYTKMSALHKHKSGCQKRKLKLAKEEKALANTQVISTYFKPKVSEKNEDSVETIPPKNKILEIKSPEQPNISIEIHEHHEYKKANATSLLEIKNSNFTDPGYWPLLINEDIRQQIIIENPTNFDSLLKIKKTIPKDLSGKSFSEFLLYTKSSNNREKHARDWLIYSTFKQTLHCFPCLLFNDNLTESIKTRSVLAKRSGFSPKIIPWKKLYSRIPIHENSEQYGKIYNNLC